MLRARALAVLDPGVVGVAESAVLVPLLMFSGSQFAWRERFGQGGAEPGGQGGVRGVAVEAAAGDDVLVPGVGGQFEAAMEQKAPAVGAGGATKNFAAAWSHQIVLGWAGETAQFAVVGSVASRAILAVTNAAMRVHGREDGAVHVSVELSGGVWQTKRAQGCNEGVRDLGIMENCAATGDSAHDRQGTGAGLRQAGLHVMMFLKVAQADGGFRPGVESQYSGAVVGVVEQGFVEAHLLGSAGVKRW